jgi:hypothetical protein
MQPPVYCVLYRSALIVVVFAYLERGGTLERVRLVARPLLSDLHEQALLLALRLLTVKKSRRLSLFSRGDYVVCGGENASRLCSR